MTGSIGEPFSIQESQHPLVSAQLEKYPFPSYMCLCQHFSSGFQNNYDFKIYPALSHDYGRSNGLQQPFASNQKWKFCFTYLDAMFLGTYKFMIVIFPYIIFQMSPFFVVILLVLKSTLIFCFQLFSVLIFKVVFRSSILLVFSSVTMFYLNCLLLLCLMQVYSLLAFYTFFHYFYLP